MEEHSAKVTTPSQYDQLINFGGPMVMNSKLLSPNIQHMSDLHNLAISQMNAGHYQQAVDTYLFVVNKWPSFVGGRVNLAHCLRNLSHYKEALEHLSVAHRYAPTDPDIHLTAGSVFSEVGDKVSEISQYYEALNDDPASLESMNSIGAVYLETNQLHPALFWFKKTLSEIDRSEGIWKELGKGHRARVKLLTMSNLARLYQRFSNWEEAAKWWRSCLSLAPDNPMIIHELEVTESRARLLTEEDDDLEEDWDDSEDEEDDDDWDDDEK